MMPPKHPIEHHDETIRNHKDWDTSRLYQGSAGMVRIVTYLLSNTLFSFTFTFPYKTPIIRGLAFAVQNAYHETPIIRG